MKKFSNSDKTGLKCGDMAMSYKSIFQDIRSAVDWAHFDVGASAKDDNFFLERDETNNLGEFAEIRGERRPSQTVVGPTPRIRSQNLSVNQQ